MMRAQEQTTVWVPQASVAHTIDGEGWRQQLRQWWTARREGHRRATLAALEGYWDPQREVFRPLQANAAIDVAAAQGTLSMATMLYTAAW
jgi:hypothetical protein